MTFTQVIAAGLAFGVSAQVATWVTQETADFLRGFIFAFANRRAAMLRAHTKHCTACGVAMSYYCHQCGHHDKPFEDELSHKSE